MSKLTDEQIQAMYDECDKKSDGGNEFMLMFASAIEAAATEPLLKRIAELEDSLSAWRRNAELADQANRELERQLHEQAVSLEEARKDAEPIRRWKQRADELIAAFENAPDGKALDMQKGQS